MIAFFDFAPIYRGGPDKLGDADRQRVGVDICEFQRE